MTAIVPTRGADAPIAQLLSALEQDIERTPSLSAGLDILIVVDGTEDDRTAVAERFTCGIPLQVIRSAEPGCAGAKNSGWESARGELVWFIDDDEVPTPGALASRRSAHERHPNAVIVGPNHLVRASAGDNSERAWFERRHAVLASRVEITDPREFSAANTSAPRALIADVGGFPRYLRGWGYEDIELGHRLLGAGATIIFVPTCAALHAGPERSIADVAMLRREGGRNIARVVAHQPELLPILVPTAGRSLPFAVLRKIWQANPNRGAQALVAAQSLIVGVARVEWAASAQRSDRTMSKVASISLLRGMIEDNPTGAVAQRRFSNADIEPPAEGQHSPALSHAAKQAIMAVPGVRRVACGARGLLTDTGILAYQPDDHSVEFWEATYSAGEWDYFAEPEESYRYSVLVGLIGSRPSPPDIIDIGCGQGLLRQRLDALAFESYVGIDIAQEAIDRATSLTDERSKFLRGDALQLDLERADIVVLNEVLSIVSDPVAYIRRAHDLLRPGGLLLTSNWGHPGDRALLRKIDQAFVAVDRIKVKSNQRYRSRRGWTITCHRRGAD